MTNIGLWQCVDIGIWQSGCYSIVPTCGKLKSNPAVIGKIRSDVTIGGQFKSEPKTKGKLSTFQCEN